MPKKHRPVRAKDSITFKHNPPRAILFGAVSSEAQAKAHKASLDEQFNVLREAMQKIGAIVIDEISIPGVSREFRTYDKFVAFARSLKIDDPARMIDHWQAKDFDIVAVINPSRFARTRSLANEFIDTTYEDADAYVFTPERGIVAFQDHEMFAMMEGSKSAGEIREIVRRHEFGVRAAVREGRHPYSELPFFHTVAYDKGKKVKSAGADGKRYYLVVDRTKQPIAEAFYDLFVKRHTPYYEIEPAMTALGYYQSPGVPFRPGFFTMEAWKPPFSGHMGYGYGRKRAPWILSDLYAADVPADVLMAYHVCEPVFPPAELAHIHHALMTAPRYMGGRARPQSLHRFSKLCICASCGYYMTFSGTGYAHYYFCQHRMASYAPYECKNPGRYAHEEDLQAAFQRRIEAFLATDPTNLGEFVAPARRTDQELNLATEIAALQQQLTDASAIRNHPKLNAAGVLKMVEEMNRLTEKIESLQKRLRLTGASLQAEQQRQDSLNDPEFRASLRTIWQQSDTEMNHLLLRFLGGWRLVVSDGEPAGWKWVED